MPDILDEIIEYKKHEVAEQKKRSPLEEIRAQIKDMPRCRNFYKALTKPNPRGLNVIAEVKKASPSAGIIRQGFDPVQIAQTYEDCKADAISVLTDEKYFQGRLEYLTRIKDAVKLPLLRKDFIIDHYQIYQARAAGADAILLIAEALTSGKLIDLMILANELTLSCLIEVHAADSLMTIRSMTQFPEKNYNILGINNRNLKTMKTSLSNTARLKDLLEDDTPIVSESGIKTRQDVEKLIKMRIKAVLIGETLCRAENIKQKFDDLFTP